MCYTRLASFVHFFVLVWNIASGFGVAYNTYIADHFGHLQASLGNELSE